MPPVPALPHLVLPLALVSLLASAALPDPGAPGSPGSPSMPRAAALRGTDAWNLHRNLLGHTRLEVKVLHEPLLGPVEVGLARLAATTRFDGVAIAPAASGDGVSPRIVVGMAGHPDLLGLAPEVRGLEGGGFAVAGRPFREDGDVVVATFADPVRLGLPLTLIIGNRLEELVHHLGDLDPVWQPGLRVLRDGELALRAALDVDGHLVEDELEDFLLARGSARRGVVTKRAPGVALTAPGTPGEPLDRRVAAYAEHCATARANAARVLRGAPTREVELRVSTHPADVMRERGALRLSHVHPGRPELVTALVASGLPHDHGAAVAQGTALGILGNTRRAWLAEGFGTWISGRWWGWPLFEWVAHLERGGLVPSLEDLLDPRVDRTASIHVVRPLRAFLVGVLLEERGPGGLRDLWRGEGNPAADAELGDAFAAALARTAEVHADLLDARRVARREASGARPLRRGVCLPVDVRGGEERLLSPDLGASLDRAAALGVDSLALSFFAFQEPRPRRWAGERARGPVDTTLSDLALLHVVGEARSRGMGVLLLPELLATPSGTWSDGHGLASPADNAAFFEHLQAFLLHYGLVAELAGCDLLALGSGRREATRTRPEEDDVEVVRKLKATRRAGWTETIERLRPVFHGLLTYCAKDGSEVRDFEFWDELDRVSLNAFPALPGFATKEDRQRSRGQLERSLRRGIAAARTAERPLLVTQIGFPSHAEAAAHPLVARGPVDLEEQERLYRLLADVLADIAQDPVSSPWLEGLYLWAWDPDPRAGGTADPGHTPQNKPAEALVPRVFEALAR